MNSNDRITLYYSPQTRATGTRVLLEELGAPYDLHVLNMKAASSAGRPISPSIRWARSPRSATAKHS